MSKPFPLAVLFDFDGVVVDSREVHHKAWSEAFADEKLLIGFVLLVLALSAVHWRVH